MPWTGTSFQKHNKALHGEKAEHASRIANGALRSGVPEGEAIAIASKWAKQHRRATGGPAPQVAAYQTAAPAVNAQGFVPVPQTGTYNLDMTTGALQPSSQAALQGFAQRGLPIRGPAPPPGAAGPVVNPAPGTLDQLIAAEEARQAQQTLQAQSGSEGGGGFKRGGRAAGGPPPMMSMSMAAPWWTRSEAHGMDAHPSGLIPGNGGGRQDNMPMNLAPHSHVIPADVVSGFGGGNTSAGALALQHAMSTGPYGTALPKVPMRPPRAITPMHMPKLASGGGARTGVRTLVSAGEYIVPPEDVHRIGNGDFDKGHDWLDRMIVDSRKQIIARQRKLPGPVKE